MASEIIWRHECFRLALIQILLFIIFFKVTSGGLSCTNYQHCFLNLSPQNKVILRVESSLFT